VGSTFRKSLGDMLATVIGLSSPGDEKKVTIAA
jgi:hypothetical protein